MPPLPDSLEWSVGEFTHELEARLSLPDLKSVSARVYDEFTHAYGFVAAHHRGCMLRLYERGRALVASFDEFFEEYVYVVVASGFRGRTAARLTPLLVAAAREDRDLTEVFSNKTKTQAIRTVWDRQAADADWWPATRARLAEAQAEGPDKAIEEMRRLALPYIGGVTSIHLARNIGLADSTAKPDIHLVRYAEALAQAGATGLTPHTLVAAIAAAAGPPITPGLADFVLWVWLSHGDAVLECCDGALRIR